MIFTPSVAATCSGAMSSAICGRLEGGYWVVMTLVKVAGDENLGLALMISALHNDYLSRFSWYVVHCYYLNFLYSNIT